MHQLQSDDPVRVDLFPGAFAMMAPITSTDFLRARQATREVLAEAEEGDPDTGLKLRTALIRSLVQAGIHSVEGVADVDGTAIEGRPSEEQVDRLLAWFPAYESFERLYAGPILEAEAEKNALSPSRNTSSAGAATTTAKAASPESPAKPDAENVQPD